MLPYLVTAEHVYRPATGRPQCERALAQYPPTLLPLLAPHLGRRGETADVAVHAYVNHGRWLVDCPFCPAAQLACACDRRFVCAGSDGCANHEVGGAYVRVVWPEPKVLSGIEEALCARPALATRNWLPSETVDDLHAENRAHAEVVLPHGWHRAAQLAIEAGELR